MVSETNEVKGEVGTGVDGISKKVGERTRRCVMSAFGPVVAVQRRRDQLEYFVGHCGVFVVGIRGMQSMTHLYQGSLMGRWRPP